MSEQNLQISIIEIRDSSSIIININDLSSVIINIKNNVKKYNINDNVKLSKKQLLHYKFNKQKEELSELFKDPDVIKCLFCFLCFSIFVIISLIIRHNNN